MTAWVVRAVPGLQNPLKQRLASAVIDAFLLKKNGIEDATRFLYGPGGSGVCPARKGKGYCAVSD